MSGNDFRWGERKSLIVEPRTISISDASKITNNAIV